MTLIKSKRKRALVILGAGASLEFGAPSTSDLTKQVRKKLLCNKFMCDVGADQAYQRINDTLALYLQGGHQAAVTFEHVYHCAQEILSTTFGPTLGAVDQFKPILYPFIGRCAVLNEENALRNLVSHLPNILFSELSAACDQPKIDLTPLSKFVQCLRKDHVTRIYTTNYDDFVLQAVPDLYYGFNPDYSAEPKHFNGEAFWNAADEDCVFHLHGSVHFGFPRPKDLTDDLSPLCWYEERAEALRYSVYNGSPERQMDGSQFIPSALITGFDKLARMQQTPQTHYYASLARDGMKADIIYVIGFGLADLHITARLAEARCRRRVPPLLFVDYWNGNFLNDTQWDIGRKEIEMLHKLRLHIVGDYYNGNVVAPSPGWTMDNNNTCAVWDKGFLAFLNAVDKHEDVVSKLTNNSSIGNV